jgi:hypothetical protein
MYLRENNVFRKNCKEPLKNIILSHIFSHLSRGATSAATTTTTVVFCLKFASTLTQTL